MNRVQKITIKNFRQIDELEINFKGESTYYTLAGKNRVGKTSILEAIDLAFNQNTARYTKITESDFLNNNDIEVKILLKEPFFLILKPEDTPANDTKERLIPCYEFTKIIRFRNLAESNQIFSSEFDVKWEFDPVQFEKDEEPFKIKQKESELKKLGVISKNQYIVRTFSYKEEEGSLLINYAHLSNQYDDLQIFGFQYLQRLALPQVFYFDSNREKEIIQGYNTLISKITEELEWRYRKKLISDTNSIIDDSLKLFNEITNLDNRESEIFKGVSKILEGSFDDIVNGDEIGFYPYNWNSPYSNSIWGIMSENQRIIPMNKIGSGISNLLALVLSISFARVAKNPVILLIDEPELHLESKLKKKIFRFLKSIPEFVIVATHSAQFIDKEEKINNIIIEDETDHKEVVYGNSLSISDLIFRLYGESINDLFIPEKILIVEGKNDKQLVMRCLELLGHQDSNIQIISAGGKDRIPDTPEQYEEVIKEVLSQGEWYSLYINKVLKIMVDEDVSEEIVNGWINKYNLDKESQVLRIGNEKQNPHENCFEYIYPHSLIRDLVEDSDITLNDGTKLYNKKVSEVTSIILSDEEKEPDKKEQRHKWISKQRLNKYVTENLTKEILESEEGNMLNKVVTWVTNEN
jgi:predicted ATP-dependent endonuclease of OLD family